MNQSDINESLMDYDDYYMYEDYNGAKFANIYERYEDIKEVSLWLIVTMGFVLTPVAIAALSSLVKKGNAAPTFVINLLVSDVIQLCAMIIMETADGDVYFIGYLMYISGVTASVGFMVCIAMERYLLIVWPLWYRTRRTVKMSMLLCAVVWTLALFFVLLVFVPYAFVVFLLIPFPLLIFFLVGTLRALSASISVRGKEKRRIVGLLVLVLLIYTLLFLPSILSILIQHYSVFKLNVVAEILLRLNPVADLFLYIFLTKEAVNQVWFCLCCCRKNRTGHQSSSGPVTSL